MCSPTLTVRLLDFMSFAVSFTFHLKFLVDLGLAPPAKKKRGSQSLGNGSISEGNPMKKKMKKKKRNSVETPQAALTKQPEGA